MIGDGTVIQGQDAGSIALPSYFGRWISPPSKAPWLFSQDSIILCIMKLSERCVSHYVLQIAWALLRDLCPCNAQCHDIGAKRYEWYSTQVSSGRLSIWGMWRVLSILVLSQEWHSIKKLRLVEQDYEGLLRVIFEQVPISHCFAW